MMRKNLFLILLICCAPLCARYKEDGIKAIIYGEQETVILLSRKLGVPGLDGQIKSLDDLILENLVYLDAKNMGAMPDQEAMQCHWNR